MSSPIQLSLNSCESCVGKVQYLRFQTSRTPEMANIVVFWAFFTQVLLHFCLGAPVKKLNDDDLKKFINSKLACSGSLDKEQPESLSEISEESDHWNEWDDFEEGPVNSCNLTSFELPNKASYLCQDGTAWSVDIKPTGGEKCIYSRNVKNPNGENEIKKTAVKCSDAKEWMEDLMQYDVLSGIPDMFLFNSKNIESENNENIPIVYEPFPIP